MNRQNNYNSILTDLYVKVKMMSSLNYHDIILERSNIWTDIYNRFAKINGIYSEFAMYSTLKTEAVMYKIKECFLATSQYGDSISRFYETRSKLIEVVKNSKNYKNNLPFDRLEYCVELIMIDAFFRCKIFKKPGGVVCAAE